MLPRREHRGALRGLAGLPDQMLLGAIVGFVAGGAFGWSLGGAPAAIAFGAALGLFSGLIIGLVLWVGSDAFPEEPIPTVREARSRDRPAERGPRR
jgi:hypothetical protein